MSGQTGHSYVLRTYIEPSFRTANYYAAKPAASFPDARDSTSQAKAGRRDSQGIECGGKSEMTDQGKSRRKWIHIGAPACFALELACRTVSEAFDSYGCYVVGSVLERPNWRDVDIRMIMSDGEFKKQFPSAGSYWEHDAKWLLLTVSISQWMSEQTGLPVDFQFQPQTYANARHKGQRNAIGFKVE